MSRSVSLSRCHNNIEYRGLPPYITEEVYANTRLHIYHRKMEAKWKRHIMDVRRILDAEDERIPLQREEKRRQDEMHKCSEQEELQGMEVSKELESLRKAQEEISRSEQKKRQRKDPPLHAVDPSYSPPIPVPLGLLPPHVIPPDNLNLGGPRFPMDLPPRMERPPFPGERPRCPPMPTFPTLYDG